MQNSQPKQPKKVVFLFGGPSAEHEVSLATAKAALAAFPAEFVLLPVFITKNSKWITAENYVAPHEAWAVAQSLMAKSGTVPEVALEAIERTNPYVVFLGLHGEFGEDGTVQNLLETHGLAYTGSDAEASSLAIDKPKFFQLLQDEGVEVPEFLEVTPETEAEDVREFVAYHDFPIVALPADRGSSVGISIVRKETDLDAAIAKVRAVSERVIVTEYIAGREFSCGVLVTGADELTALPPTEIKPQGEHEFFDYEAKYTPGHTLEITPPDLPEHDIKRIQALAKRVHQLIGADGYSRTDMILDKHGMLHILEINTLPGLTPTSILPQEAAKHGIAFSELLATLCNNVDRSEQDYATFTADIKLGGETD